MILYLYKISQSINDDYDTYDSAVVVAQSKDDAKLIQPDGSQLPTKDASFFSTWVAPDKVDVQLVGVLANFQEFKEGDVVVASFNAG